VRPRATWLLLAAAVLGAGAARAEHFDIRLTLRTSAGVARASWDTSPPEGGLNRRERVSAPAGEDVLLEWDVRSEFPHGDMKRVTIRIFVAPEAELGQRKLPPEDGPTVMDNRFTSTFLPHHAARGHVRFRVLKPGNYLVRLESEETLKEHGHEHFAALDLRVE
jgi:hypothetical protein